MKRVTSQRIINRNRMAKTGQPREELEAKRVKNVFYQKRKNKNIINSSITTMPETHPETLTIL